MSGATWRPGEYVTTDQAAEQMAAAAMRDMGYADAQPTPPGPDGGIDVRSRHAIAQVKFQGAQTGRSDLQRLVGARGRDHELALFFFAVAGYSGHAVEYADEMDVALYTFDPLGKLTPRSRAARQAQARATAPLPRPVVGTPSPTTPSWWRQHWWQAGTVFCWISLPFLLVNAIRGVSDTGWGELALCAVFTAIGTAYWRYRHRIAEFIGKSGATTHSQSGGSTTETPKPPLG